MKKFTVEFNGKVIKEVECVSYKDVFELISKKEKKPAETLVVTDPRIERKFFYRNKDNPMGADKLTIIERNV